MIPFYSRKKYEWLQLNQFEIISFTNQLLHANVFINKPRHFCSINYYFVELQFSRFRNRLFIGFGFVENMEYLINCLNLFLYDCIRWVNVCPVSRLVVSDDTAYDGACQPTSNLFKFINLAHAGK